jgi:hypothetical protein
VHFGGLYSADCIGLATAATSVTSVSKNKADLALRAHTQTPLSSGPRKDKKS